MADDPARLLADQRAAQLQADARVQQRLIADYNQAWQRILEQLRAVNQAVTSARAAGVPVDQAWIERYLLEHRVDRAVEQTIVRFVEQIEPRIASATRAAGIAGATDADRLTLATISGVLPTTLPVEETSAMAAALRPGAPLRALLEEVSRTAAFRAQETLVTAVALGRNPRETARQLRDVMVGTTLARALRISRTETLGAYRRAAVERYRTHRDVVGGWVWVASLSPRTCAACIAMHGTIHPLEEPFASHPNCRCSPAPVTRPWRAFVNAPGARDLTETRLIPERGDVWFARQPRDVQLRILGPGKFAAYESGQLQLTDLVQPTLDPIWGPGIRERSLRSILGDGTTAAPAPVAEPMWASVSNRSPAELERIGLYERDPAGELVPGAKLREQEQRVRAIGREIRGEYDQTIGPRITELEAEVQRTQSAYDIAKGEAWQAAADLRRVEDEMRASGDVTRTLQTDPAVLSAQSRFHELSVRQETLGEEAIAANNALMAARRDGYLEVIGKRRELGEAHGAELAMGRGSAVPAVRQALSAYPRDWIARARSVNVRKTSGRAYYSPSTRTIHTDRSRDTALHELGHFFEHEIPEVSMLEHTFYQRRTRGGGEGDWWKVSQDPETSLGYGYRRTEKTREDEFIEKYMGKTYGNSGDSAHEIMSMGMEALFGEEAMFGAPLAEDEDMMDFVLGVLGGV